MSLRLLLPLVALTVACNGKDSTADTGPVPTYYADVEPILTESCVNCHVSGGIGPMPLTSYEEVGPVADWVASAVVERRMPPAQVADGCNEYVTDPALTEEERDIIARWADGGAPEGDPADALDIEPEPDPLELSRIDLRIPMPTPYSPEIQPDEYRCFLLDWPEEEDVYVTGFGVAPGELSIVHHVIAFVATPELLDTFESIDAADPGPGYSCYGGPFGDEFPSEPINWLGAWVPGAVGWDNPEGTGVFVEPGSKIIVQMHYNSDSTTGELSDQTELLLKLDDEVERVGWTSPITNRLWPATHSMEIPANSEGVTHRAEIPWVGTSTLYDVGMHMHTFGRSGELSVTHADGSETCLVRFDTWDFNWQRSYRLAEPLVLSEGDTFNVTCTFDNPTDEDINWGEGTGDEMCLGVVFQAEGG
ncbi:MAG: hypothetical protein H6739_37230 [Alphaproteobacteria bacterium]|nr:hypothetical protein [Alphaproteobacteria bacterium]